MRPLTLLVVALLPLAAFGSSADLEKARRSMLEKKPGDAAKAVEAALKTPGNSRETLIELYELKGLSQAEMGQAPKAIEAFLDLLELDPVHELAGKHSAKVTTAFKQARKQQGEGLEIKQAKAGLDGKGRVIRIALKVKNDERHLVEKVVFHYRADSGQWTDGDGELSGMYAAFSLDAASVEWWAEVKGLNDAALAKVGSQDQPVLEGQGAPGFEKTAAKTDAKPAGDAKTAETKTADAKTTDPKPAETKPVADSSATLPSISGDESGSALRPVGYVAAGLGVVAIGVGAYFGVTSNNDRAKIAGLKPDSGGLVTSLTQKQAYALDAEARSDALIANVLMGAGAGVFAVGVLFWFLGAPSSDSVSLLPTFNGFAVAGHF
ncbi:MAG: hypothetical protein QM723_29280 [Myxococcaceae bacterium]